MNNSLHQKLKWKQETFFHQDFFNPKLAGGGGGGAGAKWGGGGGGGGGYLVPRVLGG